MNRATRWAICGALLIAWVLFGMQAKAAAPYNGPEIAASLRANYWSCVNVTDVKPIKGHMSMVICDGGKSVFMIAFMSDGAVMVAQLNVPGTPVFHVAH
jgi:hypothetical protein